MKVPVPPDQRRGGPSFVRLRLQAVNVQILSLAFLNRWVDKDLVCHKILAFSLFKGKVSQILYSMLASIKLDLHLMNDHLWFSFLLRVLEY